MKIMKKSLLATLVIITMLLVFIPVNRVRATTHLDEIRFTGNLSEIVEGELGGFSIETSTECASIEDIRWVKKSGASSTWTEIEGEKRDVSVDGVTSYGLKLEVKLSNDYAFDGMTTIYYNEKDMIAETETEVEPFDGGGYVVIDLGKARKANEYILSAKTYDSDNRIEGDSTVGSFSISYGEASTGNKNDIEVDAIENVNYIATAYPSEGFKFVEWAEFGIDEEVEKAFRVSEESTYSFTVNHDLKLYAIFEKEQENGAEPENPGTGVEPEETTNQNNVEYRLTSANKQATAIFNFSEGHIFTLNFEDVLAIDPAVIEENYGVSADVFKSLLEKAKNNTKKYGDLLNLYAITIDGSSFNYSDSIQLRIRMTDNMKEYGSFKLVYLDDENDFNVEEIVSLNVEGNELVGNLNHLSAYALVAEKTEMIVSEANGRSNPKTGDSIIIDAGIFIISIFGLAYTNVAYKNKDK